MKALICGWFSFKGGSTAGDLLTLQVLCRWLDQSEQPYDVAVDPSLGIDGVDWRAVAPTAYTDLIYVCGPVVKSSALQQKLFQRFRQTTRLIGLNVSLFAGRNAREWNPFDA